MQMIDLMKKWAGAMVGIAVCEAIGIIMFVMNLLQFFKIGLKAITFGEVVVMVGLIVVAPVAIAVSMMIKMFKEAE